MKTLVTNGLILDGSGSPAYPGGVAVEDGRITDLGSIPAEGFDRVLDARGGVICPGFIDTHSHSDIEVFNDPSLAPKVMQGITTDILGQDGIAPAPLPGAHVEAWQRNLAGLDGESDRLDWSFGTTDGYLRKLEANGCAINLGYLIPHGNVRMEVMGLGSDRAGAEQCRALRAVLRRELEAGGLGLSTGLVYVPCGYADQTELVALCREAAACNRPFVVHQRSESDWILESMRDILACGRDSGVAVHFSHFKLAGLYNADKFDRVLDLLDEAAREGIRVSFDQYPYTAGSTMLGVILPPWAHDGGTNKLLERLRDPAARARMIQDINSVIPGWDNYVRYSGVENIYVSNVKTEANREVIGKNLIEIGEMRGKSPLEAALDLLYQEDNAVGMYHFYGSEEHIKAFMARPEMNVCTDGLLGGEPHPRVYGTCPRVLGKYAREEKVFPLSEAVRKMTGRPAAVFGLKDRGLLKTGFYADITVFDPDTVRDRGTFGNPRQYPEGIHHVLVNGEPVVRDGRLQDVLPGRVLRA